MGNHRGMIASVIHSNSAGLMREIRASDRRHFWSTARNIRMEGEDCAEHAALSVETAEDAASAGTHGSASHPSTD